MDIRRIQMTGGSSYIVTLPKSWIQSANLKKNDSVGISIQPDGSLHITSKTTGEPPLQKKTIPTDALDDPTHLHRHLIAAYIAGFSTITITCKKGFPTAIRTIVRDFTQTAIGQEVVEELEKTITIKDLLNPTEMPFESTLKRMHILAKTMHEDAITALREKTPPLLAEVITQDHEVDRLLWLLARQHNLMLRDVTIAQQMKSSIIQATHAVTIGKFIERIGDHGERIARNAIPLLDHNLDPRMMHKFESTSHQAIAIFNGGFYSYFKKNPTACNEAMDALKTLRNNCADLNKQAYRQKVAVAIPLRNIAESLRRTGEVSGDMSEQILDFLIGGDTQLS